MKSFSQITRFARLLAMSAVMFGQTGLDPTDIRKPLADDWPTFNGDYSARRYSLLKQIDQSNVKNLSLAWVTRFTAGSGPKGNIPAAGGRGSAGPYPVNIGGLGTGELNNGGNPHLGGGILMV